MSLAERKLNHAIREKILALDPTDIRVEYFRPDEGMRIYHVGRGVIMDLAEEANALYGEILLYSPKSPDSSMKMLNSFI
jgi:hypothetical protein